MSDTYLSERIYQNIDSSKPENVERTQYWNHLLGETTVKELREHNRAFVMYLQDAPFEEKQEVDRGFLHISFQEERGNTDSVRREIGEKKLFFAEFYKTFLKIGKRELESRWSGLGEEVEEMLYEAFEDVLAIRLQNIALRTLIAELHSYKQKGNLSGETSEQEYESFCKICGSREFFGHISETYPVLIRCLKECTEKTICYYEQVMRWVIEDRESLSCLFGKEKDLGSIVKVESGLSDSHHGGKEVLTIYFANGSQILLKPRSMENEQFYQKLLDWIGERTGTDQYFYPILSGKDHSWCQIVEYKPCNSEAELHQYYQRLGEQLFLAYLLGTNDIHFENLIACGAYPVMIDLEALVHNSRGRSEESIRDTVQSHLWESVLATGILPSYTWNNEGEGIDGSAIHSKKGQKLPFKIPTVAKGETSEMYVTYREGHSSEGKNLAHAKEGMEDLVLYVNDILEGFSTAYQAVEKERTIFEKELRKGTEIQSRTVLMHTQRYTMLLNSSYHPALLMDGADREIFLSAIGQGRWEQDEEIVREEIGSLLRGDIPYFSFAMGEKDLSADGRICVRNLYDKTACDRIVKRLQGLCGKDRKRQCDFIQTSVELIPENRSGFSNKIYPASKSPAKSQKDMIQENIKELTERLCDYAIWNPRRTEVSWYAFRFASSGNYAWEIEPMGVYFYDGWSGLLLLTTMIQANQKLKRVEEIQTALKKQVFQYTDNGLVSLNHLQSQNTGAYTGEGSLIYAYLNLYRLTNEKVYLQYAVKHAGIVSQILEEDSCSDLLGGKAGAAWVFLQLYQETQNQRYIQEAERAICLMLPQMIKTERGVGWNPESVDVPIGGMAHGNAGILMPVLVLWELTKKKEYGWLAEKIWEYEESLYREETGNWMDIRDHSDEGEDTVAWCHGAAGILLSRLWCYEKITDSKWKKRLKKDIDRGYQKTSAFWKRDSWSLCHGNSGNLWILNLADQVLGKERKERGNYEKIRLLPQERMNPGLMGGYGGVLLHLLVKLIR